MSRSYTVLFASFPTDERWGDLALHYMQSCAHQAFEGEVRTGRLRFRRIRHPIFMPKRSTEESSRYWMKVLESVLREAPDMLCLSGYLYNIEFLLRLARTLKRLSPATRIVLGGQEVWEDNGYLRANADGIDVLVFGEGERTFVQLVGALLEGKVDLSQIGSLAWRPGPGLPLIKNPHATPQIDDLSEIPSTIIGPYASQTLHGQLAVCIETLRGCPFQCSYCNYPKQVRGLRRFPLERCLEEIEVALATKPEFLYLMDPSFLADSRRAVVVLEHCAKHNNGVTEVHLETTVERIDQDIANLMAAAGVNLVEVGIQSTHPPTCDVVRRHNSMPRVKRGIEALRAAGINPTLSVIADLPYHDLPVLTKSIADVVELCPDVIEHGNLDIFQLVILPGSALRSQADELGIVYSDFPPYMVLSNGTVGPAEKQAMIDLIDLVQSASPVYESGCRLLATLPGHTLAGCMGEVFAELHDDRERWQSVRALIDARDTAALSDAVHAAMRARFAERLGEERLATLDELCAFLRRRALLRTAALVETPPASLEQRIAAAPPPPPSKEDLRDGRERLCVRVRPEVAVERVRRDYLEWDQGSSAGCFEVGDAHEVVAFHVSNHGHAAYSELPERAVRILEEIALPAHNVAEQIERMLPRLPPSPRDEAGAPELDPLTQLYADLSQLVELRILDVIDAKRAETPAAQA